MRILIVEDALHRASAIQCGLEGRGQRALVAGSGEDAMLHVRTEPDDRALPDIRTPGRGAQEVLGELRRLRRDLPVIMIATRDGVPNTIGALGRGADDIIRPFNFDELLARISGRLRSRQRFISAAWEYDFEGESNIVDVYVRNLRNKLDRAGGDSLVTLARGKDYCVDPRRPA